MWHNVRRDKEIAETLSIPFSGALSKLAVSDFSFLTLLYLDSCLDSLKG